MKKNDRSKILPFRFFLKLKLKKLFAFENDVFKKLFFVCFLVRLGAEEYF